MTRILIVESNSPDILADFAAKGHTSDAIAYQRALNACQPDLDICFVAPYEQDYDIAQLDLTKLDGVVFTGASVQWSVDAEQAQPLRDLMTKVFEHGIPTLGSCNGMQLGAVVLGGEVASSPNGRELGMAKNIKLTTKGAQHPLHQGREDDYACCCVHRDEVSKLPAGAILTAGNQHSPVQAFVYEKGSIQFWGMQYHPELTPANIAELVNQTDLFKADASLAAHLNAVDADPQSPSTKALGIRPSDLSDTMRMRELINWLALIKR